MNLEQKLLGFYNYTVVLTYIGMLTGFVGIVSTFEANVLGGVICLMFAGLCDMFDGAIASTRKRTNPEKCFGIEIDSLSDLICFGILPASIVYTLNKNYNHLALAVSALYVLCALIRLAYFNVDEQERQKHSTTSRELCYGMPVTLSALFLPVIYATINKLSLEPSIALLALFSMSILFLLPFPLKKPKIRGKLCILLCGVMEILYVMFSSVVA
ncbi:phosphatidylserine synthase [Sphaerochaeta pleomorpha str. Grapes]|uniref:Phosphatidylserine synthase n=1 Tax=Sphaerochaeta pleomorpha (strain ATCC BAA-1885 / DSM 22778 / Grapes) TaxID=158190 RepID=G8QX55_SPHPG|nr:CDP-alcohol phosphatidyltransferase family protein [Sphaerochaeta pleomorpha]AEV30640.1 phosphatidylserine synthase [Sphaerochaeta pleomorpha str. Grapes]